MLDPKFFDDVAKKLGKLIPSSVKDVEKDLEKKIKAILQASFAKLDLVTREDFDVQKKVLTKTRQKVDKLEKHLAELEEKILPQKPAKKTTKK